MATSEEEMKEAFGCFDVDNTGFIARDDLGTLIRALGTLAGSSIVGNAGKRGSWRDSNSPCRQGTAGEGVGPDLGRGRQASTLADALELLSLDSPHSLGLVVKQVKGRWTSTSLRTSIGRSCAVPKSSRKTCDRHSGSWTIPGRGSFQRQTCASFSGVWESL